VSGAPGPCGVLYLTGFMGTGKTTVGCELARRLGRPFVDLDGEVERREGRRISAIFEASGEEAFRNAEQQALRGLDPAFRAVVATGGGVVLRESNRRFMDRTGVRIWLRCPLDELLRRLGETGSAVGARPLWDGDRAGLARLLAEREPFYAGGAGLVVDASGPATETVEAIERWCGGRAP